MISYWMMDCQEQDLHSSGKTWKGEFFLKKIRENLEKSGNFMPILQSQGKLRGFYSAKQL